VVRREGILLMESISLASKAGWRKTSW